MKKLLTREQACEAVEDIIKTGKNTPTEIAHLSSIKVCIAGDTMNMTLWGENAEDVRPIFRDCDIPKTTDSQIIKDNYAAYVKRKIDAMNKFKKEG